MKYTFLLLSFVLFIACDPPRNCNEPRCLFSDVVSSTPILGTFTGKTDSIIHVGDTLRFSMKIPDTIETSHGQIVFGNLSDYSFFSVQAGSGDTLTPTWVNGDTIPKQYIKFGPFPGNPNPSIGYWDKNREFECVFIPNKKGKCIIEINSGRLEITAKDGKEWLVNMNIVTTNEKRYTQYLSWMDSTMWNEAYQITSKKQGWYCFEVQ